MNNYIIDPSWFYWVEVLNSIKALLTVCAAVGVVLTGISLLVCLVEGISSLDDDEKKLFSYCKKLLPIFAILVVVAMFIPSKDTMYKMMIAKYITEENLIMSVDAIKNAVDYIVETVTSL